MRKTKCTVEIVKGRSRGQWVGKVQQITHNNRDGLYMLTGSYTRKNDVRRRCGVLADQLNMEIVESK
jgi:hypothetical protein